MNRRVLGTYITKRLSIREYGGTTGNDLFLAQSILIPKDACETSTRRKMNISEPRRLGEKGKEKY